MGEQKVLLNDFKIEQKDGERKLFLNDFKKWTENGCERKVF